MQKECENGLDTAIARKTQTLEDERREFECGLIRQTNLRTHAEAKLRESEKRGLALRNALLEAIDKQNKDKKTMTVWGKEIVRLRKLEDETKGIDRSLIDLSGVAIEAMEKSDALEKEVMALREIDKERQTHLDERYKAVNEAVTRADALEKEVTAFQEKTQTSQT